MSTLVEQLIREQLRRLACLRWSAVRELRLHCDALLARVHQNLQARNDRQYARLLLCHTWSDMHQYAQTVPDEWPLVTLALLLDNALRDLGWSHEHEQALTIAVGRQVVLDNSMRQMTITLLYSGSGNRTIDVK